MVLEVVVLVLQLKKLIALCRFSLLIDTFCSAAIVTYPALIFAKDTPKPRVLN